MSSELRTPSTDALLPAQEPDAWQPREEIERLSRDLDRRARELGVLSRVGQILTSTLDLESVLHIVIAQVRDSLGAANASVVLQEGDELVWVAAAGPYSERLRGTRIGLGQGVVGWVVKEGRSVSVADATQDPRFFGGVDAITGMQTRSLLAVPLMYKGVPRGAIEAISEECGSFDERDLRFIEGIALHAAIAIENARLFAAVEQELIRRQEAELRIRELNRDLEYRAMQLAALNRAGQAIVSTLDTETVLQLVLKEVEDLLQVEGATIFLRVPTLDEEGEELQMAAARPATLAQVGARIPLSTGIVGAVTQSGRPAIVPDIQRVAGMSEGQPAATGVLMPGCTRHVSDLTGMAERSLLVVPLMYQGVAEGAIRAVNKTRGAFDEHDREVLEVVAHAAATAIRNARLYRHLEAALQQEQKARAQLIQAGKLSVVGRMVASVAHELNNPLQTIRNSLFLIQGDVAPDSSARRFVGIAIEEAQRVTRLVDQLRDVYRPGMADQIQSVDLAEILSQVHALVAPHLAENDVAWQFTPAAPRVVNGLPDQLKQVFINLCLNACDAMRDGGGTLRVDVQLSEDGRQFGVAFRDSGPGVDPEDAPYLFDPFFTTKQSGIGLGLPICYDIVQRHGGRIDFESQSGEGATFIVWLPAAKRSQPGPA